MYIGYLYDRKKLGFSCIEDVRTAQQILDFKNFLKRSRGVSVAYIVKKGKQISILIFSKEVLGAVFILLNSSCIEPYFDPPSFTSYEVYQFCVIKSDNLRFLNSPGQISDFILKLKGGSDEFTNDKQERLVKSILAKAPESDYSEISINKFLKK